MIGEPPPERLPKWSACKTMSDVIYEAALQTLYDAGVGICRDDFDYSWAMKFLNASELQKRIDAASKDPIAGEIIREYLWKRSSELLLKRLAPR